MKTITISKKERDALLESIAIDESILKKIRVAQVEGKSFIFTLDEEDFEDFLDGLAAEVNHSKDEKREELLDALMDRLDDGFEEY
ncbi:MAG TPA: hypothetical protein P5346_11015 [Spirochaetota bacterium]|nr:hypothetical protein [Spirochaetota bacterium]HSA15258.1 hypothetical protein [Spirochaetota bacterium]